MKRHRSILYVITEDWFFCSHFLARGVAARRAGYEVGVATRVGRHGDKIRSAGLKVYPVPWVRAGLNPLRDVATIRSLRHALRDMQPGILHNIAMKPILYGSVCARLAGIKDVVNAPVGLGYLSISRRWVARLLRPIVALAMRGVVGTAGYRMIFENPDNLAQFVHSGMVDRKRAVLIRGAGVDTKEFKPTPEPPGTPVVVLIARMLWDKGIKEFVSAAGSLKERGVQARFVLVGGPDTGNPAAVPEGVLRQWDQSGVIEWWGYREDIPSVIRQAHICVLPSSYGEGLPKSLLEAAACGRPIVATDAPGCREVVRDGDNGILIPVGDTFALVQAVERLLEDPTLRHRMGERGRRRVEEEFSEERVIRETLEVYAALLR